MRFARFWTRSEATDSQGEGIRVVSRGWSDASLEEARQCARQRAQRLADRIVTDRSAPNQYDYGDAPVPEPVVLDLRPEGAAAAVTRNSYGSLVLNADELIFADVDDDGGSGNALVDRIRRVVERNAFSARLYRTAAGYRVMVTNRRVRGGGDEAEALLVQFGSDPMYTRLCRVQESFRARLTPKPWRCGFRKPPVKFPFEDAASQRAFREWEAEYNQAIAGYATCKLVTTFGSSVDPAFTAPGGPSRPRNQGRLVAAAGVSGFRFADAAVHVLAGEPGPRASAPAEQDLVDARGALGEAERGAGQPDAPGAEGGLVDQAQGRLAVGCQALSPTAGR